MFHHKNAKTTTHDIFIEGLKLKINDTAMHVCLKAQNIFINLFAPVNLLHLYKKKLGGVLNKCSLIMEEQSNPMQCD